MGTFKIHVGRGRANSHEKKKRQSLCLKKTGSLEMAMKKISDTDARVWELAYEVRMMNGDAVEYCQRACSLQASKFGSCETVRSDRGMKLPAKRFVSPNLKYQNCKTYLFANSQKAKWFVNGVVLRLFRIGHKEA
ncbi:hypothetical protein VNO78_17530 [Psophocarpus tetragonolobus]|uniref:Uncharacterized protein n=1 Tax=Psophocarpus tetragonolobus TaxID=3891 RepID=A0AAN9SMU9_PSOTE